MTTHYLHKVVSERYVQSANSTKNYNAVKTSDLVCIRISNTDFTAYASAKKSTIEEAYFRPNFSIHENTSINLDQFSRDCCPWDQDFSFPIGHHSTMQEKHFC